MVKGAEQKRIRDLIAETVAILCRTSLNFRSKFVVEGLIGITIDDKDVLLININETVSTAQGRKHQSRSKEVPCCSVGEPDNSSWPGSHALSDYAAFVPSPDEPDLTDNQSSQQTQCSDAVSKLQTLLSCDRIDDSAQQLLSRQIASAETLVPWNDFDRKQQSLETVHSLSVDDLRSSAGGCTDMWESGDHCNFVKEERTSDTELSDGQLDGIFVPAPRCKETKTYCGNIRGSSELMQYTVIPGGNVRGGMAMVSSDGHRYGVKLTKHDVTYWRCNRRNRTHNCRAVVIQRGDLFSQGAHPHCHSPGPPYSCLSND